MARPTKKFFDDVPLPLMEGGEFESSKKPPAQKSETSAVLKYSKYRPTKRANCDDCNTEFSENKRISISQASYIRIDQAGSLYLCYLHTNEHKHRDQLAGLI